MTVGMPIATLLILLALGVFVGLPGGVLYWAILHRLGLSWRVGLALALAGLSILFTNVASLYRYTLVAMVVTWVVVVALLVLLWWISCRGGAKDRAREAASFSGSGVAFQLFVFAVFMAPASVLFLPLDTDAQGFGYLALMVREGGTIQTLAPWQPEVRYLYSPALFVWLAFLSDALRLPLHQVMLPFAHIAAGLVALLGIDLAEVLLPGSQHSRWVLPLATVFGLGLFLALMDSHYTTITAILFTTLFLVLAFHAIRQKRLELVLTASTALAAIALTHPDTIIILLIGYVPFYATFWLSRDKDRTRLSWFQLFVLIPALGVALTLPWLWRVWPLFLEEHVTSPFVRSQTHIVQLVVYQGGVIPILALVGLMIGLRERSLADVLMITWVLLVVDFSIFGAVDGLAGLVGLDVMRYAYPFSIAWHGPILVYPYLATRAVDRLLAWKSVRIPRVAGIVASTVGLAVIVLAALLQRPLLRLTQPWLSFYGAFSSRADLAAMAYLYQNAPDDALILNYPVGFEGHWVPIIAERESVAFREQPFFSGAEPYYERAEALSDVYLDPGQPGAHEILLEYGVAYVVIPQIVGEPERFEDVVNTLRWQWPQGTWYPLRSSPASVDWLELVYERDGAQVWRVLPESP